MQVGIASCRYPKLKSSFHEDVQSAIRPIERGNLQILPMLAMKSPNERQRSRSPLGHGPWDILDVTSFTQKEYLNKRTLILGGTKGTCELTEEIKSSK